MPPALPCPPEHWPRFSVLIDEAQALPAPQRMAWLAALPVADAHLRPWLAPVLARLQDDAATAAHAPLQAPRLKPDTPGGNLQAGQHIGPYELLAPLGQGGMGVVWRARRADGAYAREVALKLPHAHLLAGPVRERFERERDILARLSHPHIASFYDAGLAADGQPYLALECVPGLPLGDFLRQAQPPLDLSARLALFDQVLSAVAHAHGRLVAHRDLKPGNVMVTPDGTVKLLDFGIAKLLQADDDAATPDLTRSSLPATPRYAAPEQLQGGPVTVATDVYALGLMLFELLTGEPAWPGGPHAVDAEPPRPSRRMPPAQAKALRGDLDAIVHRALQAEPEARYPSVAALAEDLKRHRQHRPIAARRLTPWVRAGKWLRRHRLPAALGGLALASLLGGSLAVAWQAREARTQAQRALAVQKFLVSVFEAADPRRAGNRPRGATPVRELLEAHAARIPQAFASEPLLQIELLRTVAEILRQLDEHEAHRQRQDQWRPLAEQHLGPDHPWVLEARLSDAEWAYRRGSLDACRNQLARLAPALGLPPPVAAGSAPAVPTTPGAIFNLASARSAERPAGSAELARLQALFWLNHSLCQRDQPGSEVAEARLAALRRGVRALGLGPESSTETQAAHPQAALLLTLLMEQANELNSQIRLTEAVAMAQQTQSLARRLPQAQRNQAELQTLQGNLGTMLLQAGRLEEAVEALRHAVAAARDSTGLEHPTAWVPRANLLRSLHLAGRRDEAWALWPALQNDMRDSPETDVDRAVVLEFVGSSLAAEGRPEAAVPLLRQALASHQQKQTFEYFQRRALRHLGDALERAGHAREAGHVLQRAWQLYQQHNPAGDQAWVAAGERYARWLVNQGQPAAAQALFQQVLATARNPQWAQVALTQAGLARCALQARDPARALAWSERALDTWARRSGFYDVRMQAYLWRVRAAALDGPGHPPEAVAEASRLRALALAAARQHDAPGAPSRDPRQRPNW